MNKRVFRKPGRSKQLVLLTVGWTAIACLGAIGQTPAPPTAFDVVIINPSKTTVGGMGLGMSSNDGISLAHVTAKSLIRSAYGIKEELISGGPGWVGSSEYDIEAKVIATDAAIPPRLTRNQTTQMMQALLAERFKLVVHTETKEEPVYELTIAKGGLKLHDAKPGDTYANGLKGPDGRSGGGMMMIQNGNFTGQAIPIAGLVDTLSLAFHRTVIDKTGLTGKYDITLPPLRVEADAGPMLAAPADGPGSPSPSPDASGPSPFTILEEQLGLKLISAKGQVKTIVIDHIERPTEN